ncbi:MlaD family protein [Antrihabitans sp. YC2-6]|uniref:MlaD family protein n=1 Tax=Antrihabitans sp. YC2-6 TaxID=2799498 RepID=UPI0018F6BB72|nr:MlaD family protein [Antrihabitans sp. YC2-6]MBJ8344787.1 MCE family protein [Antrihabitans sp. YC2-6]
MITVRGAVLRLAIFVVIVTACSVVIVTALRTPVPGDKVEFEALFSDVSGLFAGDDVRMSGVQVGKVESVTLDGVNARVRFSVQADRPVYETTQPAVRYQNLLGQRYIELVQPDATATPVARNYAFPLAATIPSFDVSKLFNGFRPLFDTLDTAQLNQFGENILRVLQGDGAGIGPVLADLDTLTKYAKDREAVIVLLIRNLGEISNQIAGRSAQVGDLVEQLGGLLSRFSTKADEIVSATKEANRALQPAVELLEQLQGAYDESYLPLHGLFRRVVPRSDQWVEILSLVPSLLSGLNNRTPAAAAGFACPTGGADLPGIGSAVLGNQRLVICK